MAEAQKTLIYIEEGNIEEAKFMSRGFVNPGVRNRAYINSLGAEFMKNYLASEGFDVENLHNLHSISRILENNDIADILLPNIHIDVRVVFDENQIFVPKSHFEKGILPNMYAVIKFDDEYKSAEFLGYFLPEVIDKKNENKDYYFVTKAQLLPTSSFLKNVKKYSRKTSRYLTEEDILRGRELALSLNDHDISAAEEKELLELLLQSDALRESVLEFDNFETLAYNAASEVVKLAQADAMTAVAPTLEQGADVEDDMEEGLTEKDLEISDLEDELPEETLEEEQQEEVLETAEPEEDALETVEPEEDLLGDNMLDETPIPPIDASAEEFEPIEEPEINLAADEPQVVHEVKVPKANDEMSVDDILDRTIASIDAEKDETPDDVISNPLDAASVVGTAAAAAAGAAAGGIAAAGAAEVIEAAATADAVKDVAEGVSDIVEAAGTTSAPKSADIVEEVAEVPVEAEEVSELTEEDLSVDAENVLPDEFEAPKDLSDIDKVESIASEVQEQTFEHETVDMQEMDVVPNDLYKEEDLDTLSDINTMEATGDTSKQDEFIELHGISESEVVDLPMSDFVINEDGSSPLDAYTPVDEVDETSLIEMPPLEGAIGSSLDIEDTISQTENLLDDTLSLAEAPEELAADLPIEEGISEELVPEEDAAKSEDLKQDEVADVEQAEPAEAAEPAETSETAEYEDFNIEDFEQLLEDDQKAAAEDIPEASELDDKAEGADGVSEEESLAAATAAVDDLVEADFAEGDIVEDTAVTPETEDLLSEAFEQDSAMTEIGDSVEMSRSAVPEPSSVEDENFINMEDINRGVTDDAMISEPEVETPVVVTENSRQISGSEITVGEIPIDINNSDEAPVDNTPLGNLYNPNSTLPGQAIMNNPGTMGRKANNSSGTKTVVGIFGALIVLIIIGIIGFFASKMINAPKESTPQPITDDNVPTSSDNGVNSQNTLSVDKNNVMNMDNNTNALASTSSASATEARKAGKATAFVDVKKLTWEVPDYISYNNNFRQYFQSVGKSLKLALVSDLLLAKDYIYSSPVKVSVTFEKDGTFRTSQLINSSGSTQIDSIVLQTVNQTLKSLKAPRSIGNDQSTTAILKIYF